MSTLTSSRAISDFESLEGLDESALRALIREGKPSEKVWAAWKLALNSKEDAQHTLSDAMTEEPTSGVRAHWVIVLFSQGELELVSVLAQHDPSPLVRETAARYLAPCATRSDPPGLQPALASCLSDKAPRVRQAALKHLCSSPGEALLERVHGMALDPDAQVRMASLTYLLEHHGATLRGAGAYVHDADVHVRRRALSALSASQGTGTSWAMERLLVEEDDEARETLTEHLIEAGEVAQMARLLADKAPLVIHEVFAPLARGERRFAWPVMAPLFGACPDSPTLLVLCACVESASVPMGSAVALIDEATRYYEGEELWLPHLIQITGPLLETLPEERREGFPELRALLVDELHAARAQRWGPIDKLEGLLRLLGE